MALWALQGRQEAGMDCQQHYYSAQGRQEADDIHLLLLLGSARCLNAGGCLERQHGPDMLC